MKQRTHSLELTRWIRLQRAQHFADTKKERAEARALCDAERGRLADLDKANRQAGKESWLLHDWTIATEPKEFAERSAPVKMSEPAPAPPPQPTPNKVLRRPTKAPTKRLVLRRPSS
jgi:hypothetical protein